MKKESIKQQAKTLERMQQDGYNVVTCGNCGGVILLEVYNFIEEVFCPHCEETVNYCNMPDLYTI